MSVPVEMRGVGSSQPQQFHRTPLSERGGTLSAGNQQGKNYMQYSAGGAYDDQRYDGFASSDYANQGGSSIPRNEPAPGEITGAGSHNFRSDFRSEMQRQQAAPPGFNIGANYPPGMAPPGMAPPGMAPPKASDNYYTCPLCKTLAVRVCGCQCKETTCQAGHTWHLDAGRRVPGPSKVHA